MSRAGKFIPGQGRKTKTESVKADAAAAPAASAIRAASPSSEKALKPSSVAPSGGDKPRAAKTFGKPIERSQRLPLTLISCFISILTISAVWYYFIYVPQSRQVADLQKQVQIAADAAAQANADKLKAEAQAAAEHIHNLEAHGTLQVLTVPPGADLEVNGIKSKTNASTADKVNGIDLPPDKLINIKIHLDGYEDMVFKDQPAMKADEVKQLGPFFLVKNHGKLALTSDLDNVAFTMTGPGTDDAPREGKLPVTFESLPEGTYTIVAKLDDWVLKPIEITIHDQDDLKHPITFPFSSVVIESTPPGATVKDGNVTIGVTPLTLSRQRPGTHNYSLDLQKNVVEHITVNIPDADTVTKKVDLKPSKDLISSCGMDMVWLEQQGYYVGKYEVTQEAYTAVMGSNPSTFRLPNHPVESVTWQNAIDFCKKLTEMDRDKGVLPTGYHYSLPTELQWSTYNADANLSLAAVSVGSSISMTSTQAVGFSEPNCYGLYDTLGNVQEWCLDQFTQSAGFHSIRGGDWLSSTENFKDASTRVGAPESYFDKFTGFRPVLEKDKP